MREYIVPNWHVVLVHSPLGLLSIGLLVELFCLMFRRTGTLRPAGRWMILLGAVTCVPGLTSGIYAYRDTLSPVNDIHQVDFQDTWADMQDSTLIDRTTSASGNTKTTVAEFRKSPAGKVLWEHLLYNSIAVGGIFFAILVYIACSDRWRSRVYAPMLLILLASKALLIFGTHNGGLAVYQYGAAIKPPAPVVAPIPLPTSSSSDSTASPAKKPTIEDRARVYLPPAQIHFAMAGLVVAVALVALALSLRATTEGGPAPVYEEDPFHDPASPTHGVGVSHPHSSVPAANSAAPVATSRFWLVAALFGVMTFVLGLWMTNKWHWASLKEMLQGENRNMYHSILGVSIIALTLLLALVTRFARRSKLAVSLVSLLLLASLSLQVYVGVMITFDGPKGPTGNTKMQKLTSPLKFQVAKD